MITFNAIVLQLYNSLDKLYDLPLLQYFSDILTKILKGNL